MILEIDILNATVSALLPVTITGVVVGIFKVAEFNEHKKNVTDWLQDVKEEMKAHEERDAARQSEIVERIATAEQNILSVYKK